MVVQREDGALVLELDARYLEWLVGEYAGPVKVVMKRGWRDLFGMIFVVCMFPQLWKDLFTLIMSCRVG